jgi:1-deoxy-D-xylulose 5-phosphate reductoisomerase
MMCVLILFGVIGSIGASTFDLVWCDREYWCIEVLIVHLSVVELVVLVREFDAKIVVVSDEVCLFVLCDVLVGSGIEVVGG